MSSSAGSMEIEELSPRRQLLFALAAAGLVAILCLPIVFPASFDPPDGVSAAAMLLYLVPLVLFVVVYRLDRTATGGAKKALYLVLAALTLGSVEVHYSFVDSARVPGDHLEALEWQELLHERVLARDPSVKPHSYRFLPNSFVRELEMLSGDYELARQIYRLTFQFLLFYAIYRFARLYTGLRGAIVTLLICGVVYPVSIRFYGGQLTDPMSHLSFVLSFLFIQLGWFPVLVVTIAAGILAKETIAAMTLYYVVFAPRYDGHWRRSAILAVVTLAMIVVPRLLVLSAAPGYSDVSGVGPQHILHNLQEPTWPLQFFLVAGALMPMYLVRYSSLPYLIRTAAAFLFIVLMATNLLFSYMREQRNLIPLVVILAVVNAKAIMEESDS